MKVYRLALKRYPKYFRKIKFDDETYWQRNLNLDTVCLFEKEYVAIWHSTDVLDTLRDWKRCGITERDAVFIPIGSDEIRRNAT